jgi:guanylate kinase
MNELTHIEEFRSVLGHYRLSEEAKQILADLNLVILVGPTATGKNTIVNELLKTNNYHYIVSDTTRQPRVNDGVPEQDGREYWFKTEDEVLQELRNGQFLEAALIHNQQVSGTSIRELKIALEAHKTALAEIEVVGAGKAHIAKPDAIIIFNVPPSFDEWMRRLNKRSNLPQAEVRRRLETALVEYEAALTHDYYRFVINDNIATTVPMINAIAQQDAHDPGQEYVARELVKSLHQQTKEYLQANPKPAV